MAEAGVGMNGGRVGGFDKKYQSAPVNCKADRLSAFCTSRAKMSAICTRHAKTTLLVTKGDNRHFRTLRAITYKEILNKSNAILAACLHLLATFGLECRAFACKKIPSAVGGGDKRPPAPPRPPPIVEASTGARLISSDSVSLPREKRLLASLVSKGKTSFIILVDSIRGRLRM